MTILAEDKAYWSDLANTINRKIENAKVKLEMEKATVGAPFYVIHMSSDGKHTGAVLQVISETPANTSINFAGDPETVKVFQDQQAAHRFMERFHLAYAVGPLAEWLESYIETHTETVAMLQKHIAA